MPTAANSKLPPPKKFLQLRCSSRWKQEQMDHRRHCCSGDEARSRRLTGSCRSRRPLPPPPGLDSPPHLNSFAPDNYAAALSATHRQFSQCREHQASTTEEIPTTPSLQQPLETGAVGPPPPLLLWRRSSPPPPPNRVVQKPPSYRFLAIQQACTLKHMFFSQQKRLGTLFVITCHICDSA